ncbi:hypothetical protein [Streptomyces lonarensis]|uniref:Uncharacterized protein n=1 Tax=Streptomyces lonarensis TaxID=700599 RepID=A0A7X6CZI0_9ACTN|nr:hypothetical protein [Streptomyces lonarensis]NJQ05418.1 hypothetical protein [Streptomyces lonarensis]
MIERAGAAHLVWLGRERPRTPALPDAVGEPDETVPGCRRGRRSLVVNAVNAVNAVDPKSALLFLAFLTAFIRREQGPVWSRTSSLGIPFLLVGPDTGRGGPECSHPRLCPGEPSFPRRRRHVCGGVFLLLDGTALVIGNASG